MNTPDIDQMADALEGKGTPIINEPPAASTPAPQDAPPAQTPNPPAEQSAGDNNPPPPATPNNTPAAPAFNLEEELVKSTGGTVKSVSELQAIIERANRAAELESKGKTYEEQIAELKTKAEANPFANPYYEKLNELAKGGATPEQIQAFQTLHKAGDIDKMDAVEAKVLALQIRDGLTEDEARSYVNRAFKLDPDRYSEQEIADAKVDLRLGAKTDKDYLKGQKVEVETSPASIQAKQQELAQQKYAEHVQKLAPFVNNALASAKSMFSGISINGKTDDNAFKVDFPVSDSSLSGLQEKVQKFVNDMGENLPADQKGQEYINNFARNTLVLENYQAWLVEAASQSEAKVRAEYVNPSPIRHSKDHPNPAKPGVAEHEQMLLDNY